LEEKMVLVREQRACGLGEAARCRQRWLRLWLQLDERRVLWLRDGAVGCGCGMGAAFYGRGGGGDGVGLYQAVSLVSVFHQ
jgi:hypothetical protein